MVQGIGAAIMFPAALAIVVSAFELRERGKALAIFFGVSGGLTAIGPILGGYLTQFTWRAIFWVNIPVAIVAVVLTLMARVHSRSRREPLDYRGAVLVAVGMGLSVLGLQQANTWGWSSGWTWACILGGLAVLAVFVRAEARTAVPLIKVRIFRDRRVLRRQRGAVLRDDGVHPGVLLRQRLRATVARIQRQRGRRLPVHLLWRVRYRGAGRRPAARPGRGEVARYCWGVSSARPGTGSGAGNCRG